MAGFSDAFFMQKALEQANLAYEKDEVPVGAIFCLLYTSDAADE